MRDELTAAEAAAVEKLLRALETLPLASRDYLRGYCEGMIAARQAQEAK